MNEKTTGKSTYPKYGGFFSLIIDDVFTPGDVRPEFAWRRSKTTELVNIT